MTLLAPERHERILDRLRRSGTVTVQEIAQDLKVTRETVRRDLDQLETAGSLQRVHGGAVVSSSPSRRETSLRQRQSEHSRQKQAIALEALRYVPSSPDASLLLDAGTTTEALAELLAAEFIDEQHTRFLTTSSVPIAQKLAELAALDVEVLGGKVRGITGAVVGAQAVATLARRQADVAFIGTNGVDASFGLSTPDTAEAAVKSGLVHAARQVVLLADSSKLGLRTLVQFATLEEIDVLITDAEPHAELAHALHEADVRVVVAVTQ
ncbi:DeoR/GlpR family DNA-binding transcription regulator [Nesterenkonia lutea]|uniref:Lactose phosphotransferase system repressor n=1 Tax=Nesterenkonia lutea TaxID=272919 RepID=A0ABR9JBN6_9MICC|nr:DeoR/GlpR family DNA-binding transcription regulator [Nesterenkonia lutea]MBE1523200.1 DeoR family fructose operon transcriptional repressor [Nesterenkonia lutea]